MPEAKTLQPGVQTSVTGTPLTPAVQPPPSSRHRETMPVSQPPVSLPSSVLDLEAFSCVLPQPDLPGPVHPQCVAHVETSVMSTTSNPKPQTKKPELKPCKRKPRTFRPKPQPKPRIPKEKISKHQPESKPYFVPQPLGAKHIKTQSRALGNRITKPSVDRTEPKSDDEYDVEYLYLTKLVLRKKRKPTAEPSKESLPSHKRKCQDDNSEVPQAVKQARLEEPQDTLEDLEALLAEYSSSLSCGTRDFF
ncbi:protein TonB-like [Haliotis cracherodii]|uniref:protein TonB-like n=1 Tax=Haliotis cracherodii TaxID=6455 RepID=UPI0039E865DF